MSECPRISDEAVELIRAMMETTGDENVDATVNLHRYIERLEKRRPHTTQGKP